jgi:hypothetical protein
MAIIPFYYNHPIIITLKKTARPLFLEVLFLFYLISNFEISLKPIISANDEAHLKVLQN